MYLSSIEVQGFKTFAQKTTVQMPKPGVGHRPTTVIVGPNGSGKSNLADAVRWCLGEQSLKQLRGKKQEDIIFSGSTGKGRSGFAEVTMNFETEPADKSDVTSIAITRRLERDGESNYLLNGKICRLQDIQLFLAERGIGQRSYSVIGQGMVDHILTSSPEERKVFFDDATGVRSLQMKRHQTWLKLKRSHTHLQEVLRLLEEMEPRLKLLKRQMDRLAEREAVEQELYEVQTTYFLHAWWQLEHALAGLKGDVQKEEAAKRALEADLTQSETSLADLQRALIEKTKTAEARIREEQQAYRTLQQDLTRAERAVYEAEREIELARVRFQTSWAPLPLAEIVKELEEIHTLEATVMAAFQAGGDTSAISAHIDTLFGRIKQLHKQLIKPNSEDFVVDPTLAATLADAKKAAELASEVLRVHSAKENQTAAASQNSEEENKAFLDVQRKSRELQTRIHESETRAHRIEIEIAKNQTQKEALERELQELAPMLRADIAKQAPTDRIANLDEVRGRMLKLMHKRDMIGGIEGDVAGEYKEVAEKFDFLKTQSDDLNGAIESAQTLVKELDSRIETQSEKVFKEITKAFQHYFKVLFGGGSCDLIQLTDTPHEEGNDTALGRALEALAEDEAHEQLEVGSSGHIIGVDIVATPPGKKMKSLNLLSGGEKAMTSIALLCAIMSVNPSPFVVLDEVDAALDEANTLRFANILNELRQHSQFVVITHDRATMEQGDVLYGVTMSEDGVSSLLSVKLTDITENGTTRR